MVGILVMPKLVLSGGLAGTRVRGGVENMHSHIANMHSHIHVHDLGGISVWAANSDILFDITKQVWQYDDATVHDGLRVHLLLVVVIGRGDRCFARDLAIGNGRDQGVR